MVVAAGTFALTYLRADARTPVLVVARPVAAGQELSAADVRVARIAVDPGIAVLPAADMARAVGSTATVPLLAGTLMTTNMLGPASWPPPGQTVVAVPVKAGRLAAGVQPGTHVLLVTVMPSASVGGSAVPAPSVLTAAGVVVAVDSGTDGAGTSVVSVLLPRDSAVAVASTAADLSIVLGRG
jgi:hypothetical protein